MYTIGEFSKIAHVSTRMLRYYESLGLIMPKITGSENGYRYYDASQLSTIYEIQRLQNCGVKLKEIPNLLSKTSAEKYQCYLENYQILLNERAKLNQKIHLLHQEIQKMEGYQMEDQKVIVMNHPKQFVYGIKRTINLNAEDIQKLFKDLLAELNAKGIKRVGPSQLAYLSSEFSTEHVEVEAQVQVSEDTPCAHELPACLYASTLYFGPHETIHTAYETLGNWMSEHPDYHICGPVLERFITDDHEHNVFETGVLFPVAH